ncbi:sulfite exporter TauE/SafE family protein [Arenivirga flava]|uniref:sulfite exporter TauE/SafE family protein n=1 Tax=Arenivirga flava TaxID=1930060 RepID=UPI003D672A82
MPELPAVAWALLAVSAFVVGISKTGLPGVGTVSIAVFAAVLPAKESTGTLLLLLILADVFAIIAYRRHVEWRMLLRLAPAVVIGLGLGVLFLAVADDVVARRVIGGILLAVIAITLLRRRAQRAVVEHQPPQRVAAAVYGGLGGFTTMVANAAGPVMSMYFIAARFPVKQFLGTGAWFFFLVNVSKVPFSAGLGLITPEGLWLDLLLAPLVCIGAVVGLWVAKRIDQARFESIVIALTVVGALYLLLRP